MTTVLTEVEAILNSRKLLPVHSISPDGFEILTASHFLIGRPLCSLPSTVSSQKKICNLRRWNLVNRLSADLWNQWYKIYLQSLQKREKWRGVKNLSEGDIVLLKYESNCSNRMWPLARVLKVHPGADRLVRVATVLCDGKKCRRTIEKLVPLLRMSDGSFPAWECAQACKDAWSLNPRASPSPRPRRSSQIIDLV